jgi:protein-histidine N-methyltransferase
MKPSVTHPFIAVHLLEEMKNPDSFWRPYLQVLPKDFSNFPAFFKPEEIRMCAGSQI